MSKFVNVKVSATISTDFYLEVNDNSTEDQIIEIAKKEIVLPVKYPEFISSFILKYYGINIKGLDSLLNSWNIDDIKYTSESNYETNSPNT